VVGKQSLGVVQRHPPPPPHARASSIYRPMLVDSGLDETTRLKKQTSVSRSPSVSLRSRRGNNGNNQKESLPCLLINQRATALQRRCWKRRPPLSEIQPEAEPQQRYDHLPTLPVAISSRHRASRNSCAVVSRLQQRHNNTIERQQPLNKRPRASAICEEAQENRSWL